MVKEEATENERIIRDLARKLGVELDGGYYALASLGKPAKMETSNGNLVAIMSAEDSGRVVIGGQGLPRMYVEPLDPSNLNHFGAPVDTAYVIQTTVEIRGRLQSVPGVMYVNRSGEFITNRDIAERILERTNYRRLGQES